MKAKIQLNGEFSATELEEIIRSLAETRAGLWPAVPHDPPSALSDTQVLVQDDAQISIRSTVDGGARVWLRNEGLGWFAFTVSAGNKEALADFLRKGIGDFHTMQ